MDNYRAIPDGYMTVGELAKKMGVTVRTLHHYDKAGLLSPSSETESGYRLYTDKDVIKLHQILAMKYLGFSLDDIKKRIVPLDTPKDVAGVLTEQAEAIRAKIEMLLGALKATEALRAEVLQMESVDFEKYADIVACLEMKNEYYWAVKYVDEDIMTFLRDHHDEQSAVAVMEGFKKLQKKAKRLLKDGVTPESEQGQALGKEFANVIEKLTAGDTSLFPRLSDSLERIDWGEESKDTLKFIKATLEIYFEKNP